MKINRLSLCFVVINVLFCILSGCKKQNELIKLTNTVMQISSIQKISTDIDEYVLFGDYPQTIKSADVEITKKTKRINGVVYYLGSDNCYYAKLKAIPYQSNYTFSDGTEIIKGFEYYFKVEPIKWRVINNQKESRERLLLSENILFPSCFYLYDKDRKINGQDIHPNNYKYSTIRAFLNSLDNTAYNIEDFSSEGRGFINTAFSKKVQKRIISSNTFRTDTVNDKVFLLSKEDITNKLYGFLEEKEKQDKRCKIVSDYARAMGSFLYPENECGWWWLSSSSENAFYEYTVNCSGSASSINFVLHINGGVVPALYVLSE